MIVEVNQPEFAGVASPAEIHHYHNTTTVVPESVQGAGAWRDEIQTLTAAQQLDAVRTQAHMNSILSTTMGETDNLALRLTQIELESRVRMDDEEAQLAATKAHVDTLQSQLDNNQAAMAKQRLTMARSRRLGFALIASLALLLVAFVILAIAYLA